MAENSGTWVVIAFIAIILLAGAYFFSFGGITGNVALEGENVVKLGWMGPLSGDAASYGESIKRGVELAIDDSGLENIEITFEDSQCDASAAVKAVNKLISIDGVQTIIGEVCSGATLAAAPIAESSKVVLISASSTSPDITNAGDFIFRSVPSDALQGKFGAELVYNERHRKLAVLYSNEEYGLGFNNVLRENFQGEIVASEAVERGSTDLRTQLTKIKDSGADAIYIISNSPDTAAAALRQIKELGINSAVFGSEGLKSPEIASLNAAEGLIVTSVSFGTDDFTRKHRERYGIDPGPFAAQGYDAFIAIAMAIKKGAKTGEEIRDGLYETRFQGVSGNINFDTNGDVSGNYNVETLTNSKWVSQ